MGAERLMRGAFDRMTRSGAWRFWSEGSVDKSEVTWNPETGLWHFHLHLVVLGRFIPHDHRQARHDPGCRGSRSTGAALPTCEPNLKDEWESATEGRGSVVDVREVATTSPVAFAGGIARSIAHVRGDRGGRPAPLEEWPQEVLLELAQWLGSRTGRCGAAGPTPR